MCYEACGATPKIDLVLIQNGDYHDPFCRSWFSSIFVISKYATLLNSGNERFNLVSIVFINVFSSHFPLQKPPG